MGFFKKRKRVTFSNVRTGKRITLRPGFKKLRKGKIVEDKDFGGGKWRVVK